MYTPPLSVRDLKGCSISELEALFASERSVAVPDGCYWGVYLARLRNRGSDHLVSRLYQLLGFRLPPFGVDFRSRCWFFFHESLQVGRFRAVPDHSRWRDTRTVRLHYDVSRLPGLIRNVLYDEVKPLTDTLCLGLGGLNAGRDSGDHFFFALKRVDSP